MKIDILEDKLDAIKDNRLSSIIELIINAIRDYPLFNLDDTDGYFAEIRRIIKSEKISKSALEAYIIQNSKNDTENNIWVISSLSSLTEAFSLMELYGIGFNEVLKKMEQLKDDSTR